MEHPAFANAGSEPGLEIWTIDKFEPVPIDNSMYGKFYNGDCYIVLKTTGTSGSSLSYDAHYWLGNEASQDKRGAVAILTVSLDDCLSGAAVQHREVQKRESAQFCGYFKPAIRYLEGGNESGFTEVETNAGAEKRLLKLSGCDNMRIEEVPAEASSLTKENCFILEVDHDIFVLMPDDAKATQRRKIISVANKLRDEEHNGRATIEIIDEFSSDDDFDAFFAALGSGSREDIADEDQTPETYARESPSAVYLYKVEPGDDVELTALKKPYCQSQLDSDAIYILDTPCSGIYIWLGSEVEKEVKNKCYDIAQQYLDVKGYPSWVNVTKVLESSESRNFKQYFNTWNKDASSDVDAMSDEGYSSDYLVGKSAPARAFMPDEGDGNLTITRIAGEQEDITEKVLEGFTVLYQTEVYVINYQFTTEAGDEAHVVYVWTGLESRDDDKLSALELVSEIESENENIAVVSLPQGFEIKHFLSIFKGNLFILFGGKDNDYAPVNFKGTYEDDNVRLFRVEGTELGKDMRVTQVKEVASELHDDCAFVLETVDKVYVWMGKESTANEQEAALDLVKKVVGDAKELAEIDEDFWDTLGGKPEDSEDSEGDKTQWRGKTHKRNVTPATLYSVTVKVTGKIVFEELGEEFSQQVGDFRGKPEDSEDSEGDKTQWRGKTHKRNVTPATLYSVTVKVTGKIVFEELGEEFSQQDLSDDGLYILDAGEEIYLWQGKNIAERAKKARTKIIQEYLADDDMERSAETAIVVNIKQGYEPGAFKKVFPTWEDDLWDNQTSYDDLKNEVIAQNAQ